MNQALQRRRGDLERRMPLRIQVHLAVGWLNRSARSILTGHVDPGRRIVMLKLSASAGAIEISQPLIAPIAALEPLNLLQAERRDLPLGELIVVLGGLRRGALRWKASELGLMHEFELLWIVVVARMARRI